MTINARTITKARLTDDGMLDFLVNCGGMVGSSVARDAAKGEEEMAGYQVG